MWSEPLLGDIASRWNKVTRRFSRFGGERIISIFYRQVCRNESQIFGETARLWDKGAFWRRAASSNIYTTLWLHGCSSCAAWETVPPQAVLCNYYRYFAFTDTVAGWNTYLYMYVWVRLDMGRLRA